MYRSKRIVLDDITDCEAFERLLENIRGTIQDAREAQGEGNRFFCHRRRQWQEGTVVRDNPRAFPNLKAIELYEVRGSHSESSRSQPLGLFLMLIDYYKDNYVKPSIEIVVAGDDLVGECFDAAVEMAEHILGR